MMIKSQDTLDCPLININAEIKILLLIKSNLIAQWNSVWIPSIY